MHRTQQWRERGRWGRSREWDPRHYLDHQLRPTSQELRKWTGVPVLRECGRRRGEGGVIRLVETERASLSLEPIRCGICRHDKNAENGAAVTRGRGKGALPFVILGRKGNRMVVVEVKKKKKKITCLENCYAEFIRFRIENGLPECQFCLETFDD